MGDIVYGIDFRNKKRFAPEETPLDIARATITQSLILDPEILATILPSFAADLEKDPA